MQVVLAPPQAGDYVSLIAYVLGNPYMFIGSTTVMTTGLVAMVGFAAAIAAAPIAPLSRGAGSLLDWIAPRLALVLAWFGIGSMVLAAEILLRFHQDIPYETEIQFRSGIGHLAIAVVGIALLRSRFRGLTPRQWVEAHFWALSYLAVQVMIFTPPWFEFQGQADLVIPIARGSLAAALAINVWLWMGPGLRSGLRPGSSLRSIR